MSSFLSVLFVHLCRRRPTTTHLSGHATSSTPKLNPGSFPWVRNFRHHRKRPTTPNSSISPCFPFFHSANREVEDNVCQWVVDPLDRLALSHPARHRDLQHKKNTTAIFHYWLRPCLFLSHRVDCYFLGRVDFHFYRPAMESRSAARTEGQQPENNRNRNRCGNAIALVSWFVAVSDCRRPRRGLHLTGRFRRKWHRIGSARGNTDPCGFESANRGAN